MRLAIIPPVNFLHLTNNFTYHLVLAQLLKNENYKTFYIEKRTRGDYLIVDSGAYELKNPTPAEEILRLADEIDAQEFMLPDIRFDMKANIESNLNALKISEIYNSKRKIHACIQGSTSHEYIECLKTFMEIDRIDVIGVVKTSHIAFVGGRPGLVDYIDFMKYYEEKEFHLLGVWDNPLELKILNKRYKWIRGADTKAPIFYGNLGVKLYKDQGLIIKSIRGKKEKEYFETKELKFEDVIKHNIEVITGWCKDEN